MLSDHFNILRNLNFKFLSLSLVNGLYTIE